MIKDRSPIKLKFAGKTNTVPKRQAGVWKVLVVDDEKDVHEMTPTLHLGPKLSLHPIDPFTGLRGELQE